MTKRSKQLEKLSWEHQDALKFARNLAKGLSLNTDITQVRNYAINIAENFLEPHFKLEESSLISHLNAIQLLHEAVVEVLQQHRQFSLLKQQLRRAQESELRSLLEQFRALLEAHVVLEERHFFPFIQQALSAEQLLKAEQEIDAGQVIDCSNWPDPYWKPKF